jgi:two-component system sensor histidine kinase HydH
VLDAKNPPVGRFTMATRAFQLCALALLAGLLADVAGSVWAPWFGSVAYLLPNIYYVGIVFAALSFGQKGGLIAGALAAISHAIVMVFGTSEPALGWGELGGFISVGFLAGFIGQRRRAAREVETEQKSLLPDFTHARARDHVTPLGQVTPTLVHELRTPLASIEGAGFVLEDATLPEDKRQEFVGIILKECQRLDRLVGLLDATHPHLKYCDMDVSSLLEDVIQAAAARADAVAHPLRKAALPDFPPLTCDREQLQQVITNLTVNAMQATPPGQEIVLSAHSSNNQVFIEVIDQRLGVGEESLDSILDRSSPNEHWRIQLANARQVAVQHGGVVKVKRNDNSGITTSIVLPGSS